MAGLRKTLRAYDPTWTVAVGGLLLTLLILTLPALRIRQDRINEITQWKAHLSDSALTLAEHARQSLINADLVLQSIANSVEEARVFGDSDLRREMSSQTVFEMLRNRAASVPQVSVATIVARNGDVINFTRSWPPPPINLSDRDYFKAHMSDDALSVFLSVPVPNRGTGTWTFYLARKIRNRAGETLGLALTGIESDFFHDFYKTISVSRVSSISLFRMEGALLSRYPRRDHLLGVSFQDQPVFREVISTGRSAGVIYTAEPQISADSRAVPRIVAAQRVTDYPIVVMVAAREEVVLEQWRKSLRVMFFVMLLVGFLLPSMTLWIVFLLKRQAATMVEVEKARASAEKLADAKAQFLAQMSHEIRTPLNAVVGLSRLIAETPAEATRARHATTLKEASDYLVELINNVLDFSRLEAQHFEFDVVVFDLNQLARQACEVIRALPEAGALNIALEWDERMPSHVAGDPTRLMQVLLNLMANAVKYTPSGRVTLSIRCLAALPDRVSLSIAVEDTGIGIAEHDQARLFEPFERLARPEASHVAGSGLGLAISKLVIEGMKGNLKVTSKPGAGSRFWFDLTLQRALAPRLVQTDTGRMEKGLRIVVAEDVALNRMLAGTVLESMGHRVVLVDNGVSALREVATGDVDLLLLDLGLPELDGYEVARRVRLLNAPFSATPIIAWTARVESGEMQRILKVGMNGLLRKPFKIEELAVVIARHAGKKTMSPVTDGASMDAEACLVDHKNVAKTLEAAIGTETFNALLDELLVVLRAHVADLREAAEMEDSKAVRSIAHRLAGLVGQFGAAREAEAARALEQAEDGELLALTTRFLEMLVLTEKALVERIERRRQSGKGKL